MAEHKPGAVQAALFPNETEAAESEGAPLRLDEEGIPILTEVVRPGTSDTALEARVEALIDAALPRIREQLKQEILKTLRDPG